NSCYATITSSGTIAMDSIFVIGSSYGAFSVASPGTIRLNSNHTTCIYIPSGDTGTVDGEILINPKGGLDNTLVAGTKGGLSVDSGGVIEYLPAAAGSAAPFNGSANLGVEFKTNSFLCVGGLT